MRLSEARAAYQVGAARRLELGRTTPGALHTPHPHPKGAELPQIPRSPPLPPKPRQGEIAELQARVEAITGDMAAVDAKLERLQGMNDQQSKVGGPWGLGG